MANRGVWSLENIEIKYPQGDWVNVDDVFLIPAVTRVDTCYWAGGAHSGNSQAANCDKTSIGSNTTSQIPALNSVLAGMWRGGFSSATVGYAAGSHPGPSTGQMSKIDKVTYATDTGETNMAHLSSGRGYLPVGPNNNTHGYTLGGGESGSPWAVTVSKVDRFTFAVESAELLPSTQLLGSRMNGSTSSNTEKGYVCGGNGGTIATTIEKIEYSTDTITSIPARLPLPMRRGGGSVNDDGSIGYYIGGNTSPGMTYLSSCTKHVYATDTISDVTSGRLYTPRGNLQGAGNGTYALTAGGYYYTPSGGGQHYSSVDRMSYSNESSSRQPGLNMSQNRKRGAGFGARTYARGTTYDGAKIRWKDNADQSFNWGIFVGGNGPGGGSNVDKINYVTDTIGKSSNIGGSENIRNTAAGSSATKGYFMCGRMPSWPWSQGQSFVWKYTYSTDSVTYTGGSPYLLPNRGYGGIAIDSPTSTTTFWMQGPWNPSQTSMRVTHSTGNVSNVPSLYNDGAMPASAMTYHSAAAVSNLATPVAYINGGTNPNYSHTDKYDFSTDNRISLPGANTAQYLGRHSAASSGTDGYFSSGYSPGQGYQSYMNKFTYSTETMALLPGTVQQSSGNPSWAGQEYGGSTGNKEQGYWYGGMAYSGSNITKIVYSTDTPSSLPGRMTSAQPSPVYNRGIQAGSTGVRASNRPGMIGPFPDATPTATKSPNPFPTSDKIYFSGGLTSSTAGYPPTPPAAQTISNTDKLTMASETVAAAPGANLVTGKYFATAFSSSTAAYIAGGFNAGGPQPNPTGAPAAIGGAIQTCDKIPYSTDTMTRMPNTDHCSGAMWGGAGNGTKGYWAGRGNAGSGGSYGSETDKLTFATDTIQGLNTPGFDRGHGGVGVYEGPGASGGGGIYFAQGESGFTWGPTGGSNQTTCKLMRTSTETGMSVPSLSMLPFAYVQSWSNPTHWMVQGGWTGPAYSVSPGVRSSASKTTWATETDSELPSSTGQTLSGAGSAGNNTYGYAGGGRTTSPGDKRSYVLRYTFESDTFEFRPSSNLTSDKKYASGTSAKEHTNPDPYYVSTPNVI